MGDKFDRSALRELSVGDYALMPKKMPHFGWAKDECIIQVHGIGPFQIIPASIEEHLSGWQNTPSGWVRDPNAGSFFKFKIADRVKSDRGEGIVVHGMHSEQSTFTQYRVQGDSGNAFFELEQNLAPVSQTSRLDNGPLSGSWEGVLHGFQDMRRGINQHTLEKICRRLPVRVIKLVECERVLQECRRKVRGT